MLFSQCSEQMQTIWPRTRWSCLYLLMLPNTTKGWRAPRIVWQCFALLFAHRRLENYVWFCMFVTDPAKLSRIRTRSEHIGNFETLTPNSHGTSGIGWDAHADHRLAWWATSLSAGDCRSCWMWCLDSLQHPLLPPWLPHSQKPIDTQAAWRQPFFGHGRYELYRVFDWCAAKDLPRRNSRRTSGEARCFVELGLCNLSLEFSLTHVVVAESSFGWPWWSIVDWIVRCGWLVTMIWGGRYITCVRGHCKHGRDESFFAMACRVYWFYLQIFNMYIFFMRSSELISHVLEGFWEVSKWA